MFRTLLPQPALGNRAGEPGAVLLRRAAFLEQELAVDCLDEDAAVLHRLGRVADLKQLAGGLFRISKWSGRGLLHAAALSSLSDPRATMVPSGKWLELGVAHSPGT